MNKIGKFFLYLFFPLWGPCAVGTYMGHKYWHRENLQKSPIDLECNSIPYMSTVQCQTSELFEHYKSGGRAHRVLHGKGTTNVSTSTHTCADSDQIETTVLSDDESAILVK
jgi:hypothetical protein